MEKTKEKSRQDKLHEIATMHLDAYSFALIVPVPHRFYETNSMDIFDLIERSGWEIHNKSNETLYEAFNIKHYIYDNMLPPYTHENKKSFIDERKSLLLKKELNLKASLEEYDFQINEITLWIFQEHIAFFTIPIEIEFEKYTVNELIELQHLLRNFKFLKIDSKDEKLKLTPTKVVDGERRDVLNYLLNLTKVEDGRDFLTIKEEDCVETYINGKANHLCNIHNSTISAKTISAMQLSNDTFKDGTPIESIETANLNFLNTKEMNTLNEFNFYLGSNLSLDAKKEFTPNDEYIYSAVSNYGYNVWKYSSGLILHDSCSFVGIKKYGGEIADNSKNNIYFLYILNLYISFQLKYIEQNLIDNDFNSLDISVLYEKLQILKNQYISEEAGIKFQEKEINKTMQKGLQINENIKEITENLVTTKEITKNHFALYSLIFTFIFTIMTFNISILEKITSIYIIFTFLIMFLIIGFVYKNKIKKMFTKFSNINFKT